MWLADLLEGITIKPLSATTAQEQAAAKKQRPKTRPAKRGEGAARRQRDGDKARRTRPTPAGDQQRRRGQNLRQQAQREPDAETAALLEQQAAKLEELGARLDELAAQADPPPGALPPALATAAQATAELARLTELAALDPLAAIEEAGVSLDATEGSATLPWLPGADETSFAFRREVLALAERVGVPADEIWGVMGLESKFSPSATNPQGGATGLIQWMPRWSPKPPAELRTMTREEQLPLVEAFFAKAGRWRQPGDAYVLTFWPAAIGKPDEHVIARKGEIDPVLKADVYEVNRGLDTNGDGIITVGDVRAKLLRAIGGSRRIETDGEDPSASPSTWRRVAWGLLAGTVGGGLLLLASRGRR